MVAYSSRKSNKNIPLSYDCSLACGKMAPPGGCGRIFQCKDSVDILPAILYATVCVGGRHRTPMLLPTKP